MGWKPAASAPGELFTVEGTIESVGAFARGLKQQDPRVRSYRRSMYRMAGVFVGVAATIVAVVVLAAALF